MIILTGAAGFIGSVLLRYLNRQGRKDIVIYEDLTNPEQLKNIRGCDFLNFYHYDDLQNLYKISKNIECVVHLGAISNTLEKDWKKIYENNVQSTRKWKEFCNENAIPFIFASTAAIYGNGNGPLNFYAFSKLLGEKGDQSVTLRFFNVYGPNEYHKNRMASTIYHWFQQLRQRGEISIFEYSENYYRDFIWIEDICKIICHFIENYKPGVYDVGTGKSYNFETIADIILDCFGSGVKNYVPLPADLQGQYQTNTQADLSNLQSTKFNIDDLLPPQIAIPLYYEYLKSDRFY